MCSVFCPLGFTHVGVDVYPSTHPPICPSSPHPSSIHHPSVRSSVHHFVPSTCIRRAFSSVRPFVKPSCHHHRHPVRPSPIRSFILSSSHYHPSSPPICPSSPIRRHTSQTRSSSVTVYHLRPFALPVCPSVRPSPTRLTSIRPSVRHPSVQLSVRHLRRSFRLSVHPVCPTRHPLTPSVIPSVHPSITHPFVHLFVHHLYHPSIHPPIYPSVTRPSVTRPPIRSFICPSARLSARHVTPPRLSIPSVRHPPVSSVITHLSIRRPPTHLFVHPPSIVRYPSPIRQYPMPRLSIHPTHLAIIHPPVIEFVCPSTHLSVHPSTLPSFRFPHLSVRSSVRPSVRSHQACRPFIYPFAPSIHPSTHTPPIHPTISPSIHPSIHPSPSTHHPSPI